VHVPDAEAARRFAVFDAEADALAARFWPGPLTLVLPVRRDVEQPLSDLVTAGLDTVAIRVPSHPVARALLEAAGVPVAAPSANVSGRISPTRAAHVAEDLGGRVDMILDGGAAEAGLESTIVALKPRPTLLRPGAVAREDVEVALGAPLTDRHEGDSVTAPGQLASHYAPNASVRLDATEAQPGETLLGFGPSAPADALNLSRAGDLREAAANLFAFLRALDAENPGRIAVMPIPRTGLGEAINDRLQRAAAPKPAAAPGR
jgi:L-threonylcarbamoyladenylate synthase